MDMTEKKQGYDFGAQQKLVSDMLRATLFNDRSSMMLMAQSRMTRAVEQAVTDWFRRRQDGIADTQRLAERLRDGQTPEDVWTALQEWTAAEIQRLTDDAASLQTTASRLLTDAVHQGLEQAEAEPQAATGGRDAKATKSRTPAVAELVG